MSEVSPEPEADVAIAEQSSGAPVLISICTTCKAPSPDQPAPGQDLLERTRQAIGPTEGVTVRAVQCLGVCKRPATVSVTSDNRYTFIFGDLPADEGAAALAAFAVAYPKADYGLVPWRERAQVLRKGMVARIPPAIWSPEDGSPPK